MEIWVYAVVPSVLRFPARARVCVRVCVRACVCVSRRLLTVLSPVQDVHRTSKNSLFLHKL